MDEELQGDKFIRIIVEEIKYDLLLMLPADYYDLKITGPGAGRSNPNTIKKVLNQQITKAKSLKESKLSSQKLLKWSLGSTPLQPSLNLRKP